VAGLNFGLALPLAGRPRRGTGNRLPYTVRRVLGAVLVLVGVTIATFLLLHAAPGNPAEQVLGQRATPAQLHTLEHQWGLDASLPSQFWRYIKQVARGDLGTSFVYGKSVTSLVGPRIGPTALLVTMAVIFALAITVPLAVLAASRRDSAADQAVRGFSVVALGLPSFWFGIVLIEIFAVNLKLLPVGGYGSGFGDHVKSLILPAVTAALAIVPLLIRSLRVGMLEVLDADFVAAARGNGLRQSRVLFHHVARNAAVPTVTLLGLNIAYLIGSTVIVENVFALNGVGSLLLQSIQNRDFPTVQGITLLLAVAVVIVNLITDLLAARLDPRIRLQ
jgi:peptide/nickel transport system permease protein